MEACTVGKVLTPAEVLALLPQQEPFRFVDEILEVDDDHIVATYRFSPELDFYRGHFPGNPVTPGVILVEAMAQVSVVAQGVYLFAKEMDDVSLLSDMVMVFTDAQVDFSGIVKPGERVTILGKKKFYRRRKLCADVEMCLDDGTVVCSGRLSGMGVDQ
ncbi:MAG: beta-hydroxyacyl-ACP dehydratase [Deltaproteobacteria bacterium]|nr:beta-hydroxyacyl-ACP dehydratase [Deltaproteobacteria bacterium]